MPTKIARTNTRATLDRIIRAPWGGASALDPPFTLEREGSDLKESNFPLDAVPVVPVCSSEDGRVFLLAYFPPFEVPRDDESMNVSATVQVPIE
jgi:hypothetical protein